MPHSSHPIFFPFYRLLSFSRFIFLPAPFPVRDICNETKENLNQCPAGTTKTQTHPLTVSTETFRRSRHLHETGFRSRPVTDKLCYVCNPSARLVRCRRLRKSPTRGNLSDPNRVSSEGSPRFTILLRQKKNLFISSGRNILRRNRHGRHRDYSRGSRKKEETLAESPEFFTRKG